MRLSHLTVFSTKCHFLWILLNAVDQRSLKENMQERENKTKQNKTTSLPVAKNFYVSTKLLWTFPHSKYNGDVPVFNSSCTEMHRAWQISAVDLLKTLQDTTLVHPQEWKRPERLLMLLERKAILFLCSCRCTSMLLKPWLFALWECSRPLQAV